jgi:hypothetical protein
MHIIKIGKRNWRWHFNYYYKLFIYTLFFIRLIAAGYFIIDLLKYKFKSVIVDTKWILLHLGFITSGRTTSETENMYPAIRMTEEVSAGQDWDEMLPKWCIVTVHIFEFRFRSEIPTLEMFLIRVYLLEYPTTWVQNRHFQTTKRRRLGISYAY